MSPPTAGDDGEIPWAYVAPATVQEEEPQISVPDEIVEAGIVTPGESAVWSYEDTTGVLIVSNQELEMDAYVRIGEMTVQQHQNVVRFPAPIQVNPQLVRDQILQQHVHDDAIVEPGERYHFVYRMDGMASGETRSCYLFTDQQVIEHLPDPTDWSKTFAEVPHFY
ncbi:hypothetical protein [Halopiger aswanensis]|uniref:Uncharacterized protein n=1 Tax=Halopiger aswanensis TaxID=148449 RepID=A0A3R7D6V7_9EURY|nr:hypothetical protein [Halopiger aswanensis]RKD86242.1 hypothetical protein ATJ93_4659 [Halopiger aswanensis]